MDGRADYKKNGRDIKPTADIEWHIERWVTARWPQDNGAQSNRLTAATIPIHCHSKDLLLLSRP